VSRDGLPVPPVLAKIAERNRQHRMARRAAASAALISSFFFFIFGERNFSRLRRGRRASPGRRHSHSDCQRAECTFRHFPLRDRFRLAGSKTRTTMDKSRAVIGSNPKYAMQIAGLPAADNFTESQRLFFAKVAHCVITPNSHRNSRCTARWHTRASRASRASAHARETSSQVSSSQVRSGQSSAPARSPRARRGCG
jgi:hypothetical protein